jgi:hypothetical protein
MGRALQIPFRNGVISHAYTAPVSAGLHLSRIIFVTDIPVCYYGHTFNIHNQLTLTLEIIIIQQIVYITTN